MSSPSSSKIKPLGTTRVGVLGGGQLGRMMAFAAHRLGIPLTVLDPLGEDSPAGQVALKAMRGDFNSAAAVAELAKDCDAITCEIEHVSAAGLRALEEQKSVRVFPSAHTVSVIQDKFAQKKFFKAAGIPVPEFAEVASDADMTAAAVTFGFPLVLKAKRLAYDGRGNVVIQGPERVSAAFAELTHSLSRSAVAASGAGPAADSPTYVEKFVRFRKELAVMVARSPAGQLAVYPVTETRQKDSICHTVVAPVGADGTGGISVAEEQAALQLARKTVEALGGVGIFGVEMFLLESGEVVLNEVAPRPHNSGHYTIEACGTDQFEQHLRAVTGLPLGDASLRVGAAFMLNLIGADSEESTMAPVAAALGVAGAGIHWYGKDAVKKGRKLGHITVTADSAAQLQTRLAPLAQFIGIDTSGPRRRSPVVGIIMGSDSDLPTMKDAAAILDRFSVAYELTIVSAHRTPDRMYSYAKEAHARGLQVVIAGAGGAAHLPGMVAALTPLPVIGVPVLSSALSGKDSLLSIVQMPRGVPVATVAIGNSMNAGLLAVRMLAAFDPELQRALIAYHEEMRTQVERAAERLETQGYAEYLASAAKH